VEKEALRILIRQKLADGRLPHDSIPRVWGGPSHGEICHACDEAIPAPALIMEGVALGGKVPLQLHVQCFYVWDRERRGADGAVGS
jgi:hypothetical protein